MSVDTNAIDNNRLHKRCCDRVIRNRIRTRGTRWKLAGQQVRDALEVVVASVAEVRGAEAKENGH